MVNEGRVFILLQHTISELHIPQTAAPLLTEFVDVFPTEAPGGLPPLCDI